MFVLFTMTYDTRGKKIIPGTRNTINRSAVAVDCALVVFDVTPPSIATFDIVTRVLYSSSGRSLCPMKRWTINTGSYHGSCTSSRGFRISLYRFKSREQPVLR
ncbi:unnamed protein product [Ixodes pacificus]